jgi:hypothetical protein
MLTAVAYCGDETGQAAADARRIERDLRARLEAQDRLDAAAPDLLQAARTLIDTMERADIISAMIEQADDGDTRAAAAYAAVKAARLAISAAGEQP